MNINGNDVVTIDDIDDVNAEEVMVQDSVSGHWVQLGAPAARVLLGRPRKQLT